MTGMYNVLEKLRAFDSSACGSRRKEAQTSPENSEPRDLGSCELAAKEREIHEQGLVSVLKQIHDDLDPAVFAAYRWPANLSDEEIFEHLVALNHERAEEEKRGQIRWLRSDFQCRDHQPAAVQTEMETGDDATTASGKSQKPKTQNQKSPWPKTLPEQVEAVRKALESAAEPLAAALAKHFERANQARIAEILETLVTLGKARETEEGKFHA